MIHKTRVLLSAVFVNSILWSILVPMWHTPDEQAHFAQVAFFSDKGRISDKRDILDLTEEIEKSEELLGTKRDKFGNNKFTHQPEYKINYSNTSVGIYEDEIMRLNTDVIKQTYTGREAARYPFLYYALASGIFRFYFDENIIVRVFALRFFSTLLFVVTIYLIIKIAQELFPLQDHRIFVLGILVGFQPMFVFSSIGVTSDVLGNLFFTAFLLYAIKIISKGLSIKVIFLFVTSIVLASVTKPQFIICIPFGATLLLSTLLKNGYFNYKHNRILLVLLFISGLFFLNESKKIIPWSFFLNMANIKSLYKYTSEYTIQHTYREVLPWYWGVYKWLGVTYPRMVHRIINLTILLSGVGVIIGIVRSFVKDKWKNVRTFRILFLIVVASAFFVAISVFDWFTWMTGKYPLGVQGRYFFPTIFIHMLFVVLGLQNLFFSEKYKLFVIKIVAIAMLLLNSEALITIINAYYDPSSLLTLIKQVSQYKPFFFKDGFLVLLMIVWIYEMSLMYVVVIKDKFGQKLHQNKNLFKVRP